MKTHRTQKGVAAVEFGLFLVFLLPVAFGATELGRALYQYNTLVKATRDGARVLALGAGAEKLAEARCVTIYGDPTCAADKPLLEGLDASGIYSAAYDQPVTYDSMTIKVARVTINGYKFVSMVPYVIKDITFGAVSTSMRQS